MEEKRYCDNVTQLLKRVHPKLQHEHCFLKHQTNLLDNCLKKMVTFNFWKNFSILSTNFKARVRDQGEKKKELLQEKFRNFEDEKKSFIYKVSFFFYVLKFMLLIKPVCLVFIYQFYRFLLLVGGFFPGKWGVRNSFVDNKFSLFFNTLNKLFHL